MVSRIEKAMHLLSRTGVAGLPGDAFFHGEEVMLFEPYYGYHVNTLLAVGAVPVYVSMHPPKKNGI